MYEIIDETLKLASCGISDLTLEQASSFLSQWEDGAPLGSLAMTMDLYSHVLPNTKQKEMDNLKIVL